MTTVKDIYDFINEIAPFELQESYDNSGLCIGSNDSRADKVLIALDCTREVAQEALKKGCQLIVTHHPIIFHPLKKIDLKSLTAFLVGSQINVISAHTNFDSAKMNDILCEKLGLVMREPLVIENGMPCGYVCDTEDAVLPEQMAKQIKTELENTVVRYNNTNRLLRRVGVCSGSGGSFLGAVLSKRCDAYITGDVKHDVFIDANNEGVCVFDAGHFHTENIFCEYMEKTLSEKFRNVDFMVAENSRDILSYEF